jgi:hypothetical protein
MIRRQRDTFGGQDGMAMVRLATVTGVPSFLPKAGYYISMDDGHVDIMTTSLISQ